MLENIGQPDIYWYWLTTDIVLMYMLASNSNLETVFILLTLNNKNKSKGSTSRLVVCDVFMLKKEEEWQYIIFKYFKLKNTVLVEL